MYKICITNYYTYYNYFVHFLYILMMLPLYFNTYTHNYIHGIEIDIHVDYFGTLNRTKLLLVIYSY